MFFSTCFDYFSCTCDVSTRSLVSPLFLFGSVFGLRCQVGDVRRPPNVRYEDLGRVMYMRWTSMSMSLNLIVPNVMLGRVNEKSKHKSGCDQNLSGVQWKRFMFFKLC